MTEPLILTFDIGTQSVRALLVNPAGEIVHKVQKIYETAYYSKQPGWAEQRAEFYWETVCEASRELKAKAAETWNAVIAVTCSTIRDSVLCLDRDCEPLRDVILWNDDRKAGNMPPLPSILGAILTVSGMKEGIELQRQNSPCNWIALHEPEIWKKTHKFALISAWLTYKFCGTLTDSSASTIAHIPFDSKTRNWMKPGDIRRVIFDVDNDKLYDLVEPETVMGKITSVCSVATGIPEGLPLIATGSDKGCETLGLSCLDPRKAALSFGTTATVQLSTRSYLEPLPYMPPYPAVVNGWYNPEIEIYRGYWLLSWFKREFAAKEVMDAARLGVSAEKLLDDRLKEIRPGCDGLIMQPYFSPGVDMPFAKGAIIGFSDVHTRIHLYRSIIEGINFALMEGLKGMEKRGKLKVSELYAAGGGSQSAEVCRITASMFGLPVYRTQTHEVTGIGSSMVGFKAQGIFSSYEEGIKAMVHIKDEFLPNPEEHQIYEELYDGIFTKVFGKLSPLYQKLQSIG
ncbi:MAG: FGGY-family carbohydrate kinase [Treponema sp.]|jgi:sugar (pentulose or hexulose) kinase|nr:FGGY-family carbohydrate kinase [Treponema sp.]